MSIIRVVKALRHSLSGLKACLRHEASFRLECVLFVPLTAAAMVFGGSLAKVCVLIGALLLVLMCELLNSAIEKVADLACGGKFHPLVKYAKDTASAAVLISMIIAALVWVGIFLDKM